MFEAGRGREEGCWDDEGEGGKRVVGQDGKTKGGGTVALAQKISQRSLDPEGQDRKGELAEIGLTRRLGEGRSWMGQGSVHWRSLRDMGSQSAGSRRPIASNERAVLLNTHVLSSSNRNWKLLTMICLGRRMD